MYGIPTLSVVQGRVGGWPGQIEWNDPTQLYVSQPLVVDYPSGTIEYTNIPESIALPSNPTKGPLYVTLYDPQRSGNAAVFIETTNTKFNDLNYVRLGIVLDGVPLCDWTTPGTFGASGVNHSAGNVPDPGSSAGTTKFLREDAQFAIPAGTGIGGTGTANKLTKFTGASAVGNSSISDDGTIVTISTPLAVSVNTNVDNAGQLTLVGGTAAYTFSGTYTNAPIVVISSLAAVPALAQLTVTNTGFTITVSGGTNTDTYNYICIPRP